MKVISLKQLIEHVNLTDQTKLRLNEISKTEIHFNQEIKDRKLNSKKLSKYLVSFDYIDKILIVLLQHVEEYLLFLLQLLLELL